MKRTPASERQVQAADPGQSTWLSANAGSGKTKVLTDRVARLLLGGTEPQRILCLTYTKAAASEMQNRLFQRLGAWAMLPEEALRAALLDLGAGQSVDADTLVRARRLFARAIETPGGLKIQTIHSFCAGLLRRFPLEAGVSPDFSELDDRAAKLLREEIAEEIAAGPAVAAFDAIAPLLSGEDLGRFLDRLGQNRDYLADTRSRDDTLGLFGLPPGYSEQALLGEVLAPGDLATLAGLVPQLLASGSNDTKAGRRLSLALAGPAGGGMIAAFEQVFLFGADAANPFGAKIGTFPTKALQTKVAALMPQIEALMLRVADGRERRLGLAAAERTHALSCFAGVFLPEYAARKARAGLLDFDDLITRTAHLLSDSKVAAWVLYRLDGGIDHILVDEAQDTSPAQWTVIERLAEEFTSGESARGERRTIFVVGDKKQSIYSFQGADLAAFDRMRDHFGRKFGAIGLPVVPLELEHSFRSADAVLRVVDQTFDDRVNRGLGGSPKHSPFFQDLPGRVDLWPAVPPTREPEQEHWYDPVDLLPEEHHNVVLARRIAGEIRRMIDSGTVIPAAGKAKPPGGGAPKRLDEGDILILVQRRSELFHEIIRACKNAGLAIAGADRLKIGGELAVKDLTALLRFLATPEDDLSLAATLRSPIFGWSEAQLFDLAHHRNEEFLWAALRAKADIHPATLDILGDLRDQTDFLRPFELIERVLTRHGARQRLVARLGAEAEDGIDALLAEALRFEQAEVPSLTGFLAWLETGEVEIKRRPDSASRAIRVMTVHGAKGLEAPVVILPDSAVRREEVKDEILRVDGKAIWKTRADESPGLVRRGVAEAVERQREERMRLLYVAMTRAEVWLIVCAAGEVGQGAASWFSLVADGIEKAGAGDFVIDGVTGRRHESGVWPTTGRDVQTDVVEVPLPAWTHQHAAPANEPERPLSPSALGGAKALPGEGGLDDETALRRGSLLHLLLEHLPGRPEADWDGIARSLAADAPDLAETDTVLADARRILTSEELVGLFTSESLSEVELTARLPELGGRLVHGTIDRLIVSGAGVRVIDYKSNAVVPATPADVPEGILRQMGAYEAMLRQIYPALPVETAILWTRTGGLMPLPAKIVRAALAATTIP